MRPHALAALVAPAVAAGAATPGGAAVLALLDDPAHAAPAAIAIAKARQKRRGTYIRSASL